jgi:hypothetical protein
MTMSSSVRIEDLFQEAHDEGELSAESLAALTVNADVGAQIQAGLGIAPDDVPASEVVLVTMMPDDSGSIAAAHNAEAVRCGHNLVLESLLRSGQRDEVLAHTRYLNGLVLFPYRRLRDATWMDASNYDPDLGTPLYDQTVVLLGTVLAKAREFEASGVPARSVTLLLTDGADMHSRVQTPRSVRAVVEDMLRLERHIVAAMGISDGHTDFRRVFLEMGVPEPWILTAGNTQAEIRKAFRTFSLSAVQASKGAGFGAVSVGGFAH